ncbi:murein hydrolase activator EnvC family protein [Palleronia sp.]|uniref:murein hydrolase activator EnvC family protein n=1 Tax=Palleronia sp. TaxID=1940284 RepID=UPI0035C796E0
MIRIAALLALLALPAAAQPTAEALARDAARQLEAAGAELTEGGEGYGRIDALTRVIRAYESGLSAMRDSLRAARLREAEITRRLDDESTRVGAVLNALTAMGQAPEATLLLHPAGPAATARAGMLMSDVTPAMLGEVEALKDDLREISTLRALQDTALGDLEQGLEQWQDARTRLADAIEARADLPRRITEDPATMQRLANNARTLTDFADSLAALPEDAVSAGLPPFESAVGQLSLPVQGNVLRRFDEADAAGIRRPGWVLATQPGALVTTPWPATIRYRGPLLDYRNVMILEPEAGYLVVFAGLAEVYGAAGEVLPAGAPVGIMGGSDGAGMAGFRPEEGAVSTQRLYVEVRRNGEPEDPAKWFALDQG